MDWKWWCLHANLSSWTSELNSKCISKVLRMNRVCHSLRLNKFSLPEALFSSFLAQLILPHPTLSFPCGSPGMTEPLAVLSHSPLSVSHLLLLTPELKLLVSCLSLPLDTRSVLFPHHSIPRAHTVAAHDRVPAHYS